MGVNLFVEGNPAPFLIEVTLPRDVNTVAAIRDVAAGFAEIGTILRREWSRTWPTFTRTRRDREQFVASFEVRSPPVLRLFADPAWLAVFVTVIIGYKDLKVSGQEAANDTRRLFESIQGLSQRQLQLLDIAVRLTLERWLGKAEAAGVRVAQRARRARVRLVGQEIVDANSELPAIRIIDIANKQIPW